MWKAQCPPINGMDTEIVQYSYNGIPQSDGIEPSITVNVARSHKHNVSEINQTPKHTHTVWVHLYRLQNRQN